MLLFGEGESRSQKAESQKSEQLIYNEFIEDFKTNGIFLGV